MVGSSLTLRYAAPADAQALLELGSDAEVTRFFSWGPYRSIEEPAAYIEALPGERARGERLDFLIVDPVRGPIGVTGLSELARRDPAPWWGPGSAARTGGRAPIDAARQ